MVRGWYPKLWLCPRPLLRWEFRAAAALAIPEGGTALAKEGRENAGVDIIGTDTLDTLVINGLVENVALLAVQEVVVGVEQGLLLDKAVTWD